MGSSPADKESRHAAIVFEALKKYDWGTDLAAPAPIDNAAVALGTANADPEIESQLLAALKGRLSRWVDDYVCRKLALLHNSRIGADAGRIAQGTGDLDMARFARMH